MHWYRCEWLFNIRASNLSAFWRAVASGRLLLSNQGRFGAKSASRDSLGRKQPMTVRQNGSSRTSIPASLASAIRYPTQSRINDATHIIGAARAYMHKALSEPSQSLIEIGQRLHHFGLAVQRGGIHPFNTAGLSHFRCQVLEIIEAAVI